jgi:anti-sigma factor RsiW
MTEWTKSAVRHIPEEELHAYLDQALSRSQCVEIERHLARCSRCQIDRDAIAALRDRTTELLARLGPPPIVPPTYETLRDRRLAQIRLRRQWLLRAGWAASVVGAMTLGWQANWRVRHPSAPQAASRPARQPSETTSFAPSLAPIAFGVPTPAPTTVVERPAPLRRLVRMSQSAESAIPVRFARVVETDPPLPLTERPRDVMSLASVSANVPELMAQPVAGDPGLQGLWRTILPDSSGPGAIGDVARVPGLPVVQMRVQPGTGGADITAVDQLLESGEVIRTIAGPAGRVAPLVQADPTGATAPDDDPAQTRMTVTIRQGDRMVAVTGPSQALGSLLSRVNLKRRRY